MELRSLIKEKKGDITDMPLFLVVVTVLAIGFFTIVFAVVTISTSLREAGINTTSEGDSAIDSLEDFGTKTIQRGFFLLFVGLIISTMVSSFFARTHPIFLFLYIFFLAVTIFLGVYLGNAYEQLTQVSILAETLASQSIINVIMQNIITIVLSVGALSMLIVFAKFKASGSSQGASQPI